MVVVVWNWWYCSGGCGEVVVAMVLTAYVRVAAVIGIGALL